MGVNKSALRLMLLAKKEGGDFSKMLTLGRLRYYGDKDLTKFDHILKNPVQNYTEDYSEELYKMMEAKQVESMDYSDYEDANIIHDLNQPIPKDMEGKYSSLVDSGTLEHVFHFPTAIESCMKALKVGGTFMGITPANNMMGHGFYQLSPEIYYRMFSEENGFKVKHLFLAPEDKDNDQEIVWYAVPDPKEVRSRIMLSNGAPMYLLIIAEKIKEVEIFKSTPQQSDYQTTWDVHKSVESNERDESTSVLMHMYRKYTPYKLKNLFRIGYNALAQNRDNLDGLGEVNTSHFREVHIDNILHAK